MTQFKIPTETVTLPSKGLLYSKDNVLSSGKIEMKYMTAKEEDILTNSTYISDGSVIDRVLKALVITKFNWSDLLIGDKNAIMVAARVLGYGKDYTFNYNGKKQTVDLSKIEDKELNSDLYTEGVNQFSFTLPHSGNVVEYKLLTHGDETKIQNELKGLKKINKDNVPEATTRLKHMIISVEGDSERKTVREFVDTYLLARDARALRENILATQPDVDLTFFPENGDDGVSIPIGINFFWPDA
tara:strand:- start:9154 stop:9882 length:729 start_codon:yes stop_codon:yes gene_type:complete